VTWYFCEVPEVAKNVQILGFAVKVFSSTCVCEILLVCIFDRTASAIRERNDDWSRVCWQNWLSVGEHISVLHDWNVLMEHISVLSALHVSVTMLRYHQNTHLSCIYPVEQPASWYSVILLLDWFLSQTKDIHVPPFTSGDFALTIKAKPTLFLWTL